MVLTGLAFTGIAGAAVVKLDGQDRAVALFTVLPFSLAILVTGLLGPTEDGDLDGIRRSSRRVGGRRRSGTWIRVPRGRAAGVAFVCAAVAVSGVGFAVYPDAFDENPLIVRVVGIGLTLGFGAIAVAETRVLLRGGGGLLLTPEGLGSGPTWIPWEAVTDISVMFIGETEILGVSVSDMSLVEAPATARLFSPMNRRHGADLTLPLDPLGIDSDVLMIALRRLVARPEDRRLVADPGGAEALRRLTAGAA
jgi:hypothetical protein